MLGYEAWEASDVTCDFSGRMWSSWMPARLAPSVVEQDLGSPVQHLASHLIDAEMHGLFFFFLFCLSREQGCEPQCRPVTDSQLGSTAVNIDTTRDIRNISNMSAIHIPPAYRLLVACICESQPERFITMYMLVLPPPPPPLAVMTKREQSAQIKGRIRGKRDM